MFQYARFACAEKSGSPDMDVGQGQCAMAGRWWGAGEGGRTGGP
jgi:hypothetical protein